MASDGAVEAALLEWVNDFPIDPKVLATADLADGVVLLEVLRDIDAKFFSEDLPKSERTDRSNWILKWQSLKHIYKVTMSYIREEGSRTITASGVPDVKKIANGDPGASKEMSELLKLILIAAVYSPEGARYVGRIVQLSQSSQMVVMACVQEFSDSPSSTALDEDPIAVENGGIEGQRSGQRDPELEYEEKIAALMAENDGLKRKTKSASDDANKLQDRLVRLQKNNEILQEQLTTAQDSLKSGEHSRAGSNEGTKMKDMESKIREQEFIISSKDADLQQLQNEAESSAKKIDSLRKQAASVQTLQDEIDEMKAEKEKLLKKANTVDHYKQKLQASQHLDVEIQALRDENERLSRDAQEDAQHQVSVSNKLISEYKQTLSKVEQDYQDLVDVKKRLEFENTSLHEKVEDTNARLVRDQEEIQELYEKIQDLESGTVDKIDNLDDELTLRKQPDVDLASQITRLTSENRKLRENRENPVESAVLQGRLENTTEKVLMLQRKYDEAFEKNLLLESQMKAVLDGNISEDSETFIGMRKELESIKSKRRDLEQSSKDQFIQLAKTKRKLQEAKRDLSLIDRSKVEALEEIKAANSDEVISLRKMLDDLQRENKDSIVELAHVKESLTRHLQEKDKLQTQILDQKNKELDHTKTSSDLKATLEVLKASASGREEGAIEALEKRVISLQENVVQSRERLQKRTEHIKTQNTVIKDLKDRVQLLETGDRDAITKAKEEEVAHERTIKDEELSNLQRENALMATAWYDLSGRLQLNNVVLQRRNDAPKSFLNKQRKLLSSSMGR